jgi:hypothetical protein
MFPTLYPSMTMMTRLVMTSTTMIPPHNRHRSSSLYQQNIRSRYRSQHTLHRHNPHLTRVHSSHHPRM